MYNGWNFTQKLWDSNDGKSFWFANNTRQLFKTVTYKIGEEQI